ncbi:acetyl-CoA carboxylase biotin carboxyl carrier protein subunit [Achromobacter aloeverae]|uniref:Acetyl-CoA carboxylase biotin carboxyl carrier protein subunit n=1 Tax=Achromobacter aloeverae TaxID=1750518 RepID=A0A4Q1HGQ5_9BURK|nr:acetyl-CoA carboxylase biotin carboxyl carrier protein subunit [Achromobacter aloeverae]RXN85384.1 acetyl-CoA carboxylase biotin carboxyl carrier protein subunit [Achromobacter aloeverae]
MTSTNIEAVTTGKVWKIEVQAGASVQADGVVMILESMKMEIPVQAPVAGVISQILVQEGDIVEEGQTVATLA